jgi:hypothetical protein
MGLPPDETPMALLTFNLGIEAGQLALVLAAWALVETLPRIRLPDLESETLRPWFAYGIGGLAAAWVMERAVVLV